MTNFLMALTEVFIAAIAAYAAHVLLLLVLIGLRYALGAA